MNRLAQIFICNQVQGGNENQPSILVNPMLTIPLLAIPNNFSFVISLLTTGIDYSEVEKFSIKVLNLDANNYNRRISFSKTLPKDNYIDASNTTAQNTAFNFEMNNFIFRNEGMYQVEITIDEDKFVRNFNVAVVDEGDL